MTRKNGGPAREARVTHRPRITFLWYVFIYASARYLSAMLSGHTGHGPNTSYRGPFMRSCRPTMWAAIFMIAANFSRARPPEKFSCQNFVTHVTHITHITRITREFWGHEPP